MSLRALQMLLEKLSPDRMTPEDLRALGARWPADLDCAALSALARFSDHGYTRTSLHRTAGWELLICGWLPGQRTVPHGHGESFGLTCVLQGRLTEVCYCLSPDERLMEAACRTHSTGGIFHEQPDTIHHVEHAGRDRATSLHLYAPPLERMQLYEGSTGTSQPRGSGRRAPKSSIMER